MRTILYRLIFHTTSGSGQDLAPERTIPAASRSMDVILATLADVVAAAPFDPEPADTDPSSSPSYGRGWAAPGCRTCRAGCSLSA
jgi:hypothetical protein